MPDQYGKLSHLSPQNTTGFYRIEVQGPVVQSIFSLKVLLRGQFVK